MEVVNVQHGGDGTKRAEKIYYSGIAKQMSKRGRFDEVSLVTFLHL